MSGTNKLVQSAIETKKVSSSALVSALQNANSVAAKSVVKKPAVQKGPKK